MMSWLMMSGPGVIMAAMTRIPTNA